MLLDHQSKLRTKEPRWQYRNDADGIEEIGMDPQVVKMIHCLFQSGTCLFFSTLSR